MPDLTSNTAGLFPRTPSGWPRRLPPTPAVRFYAPSRLAGAERLEDHWATHSKRVFRFGGIHWRGQRAAGFNNIELITDRTMDTNFKEMAEVKKRFPNHAVISSLMVETKEEWKEVVQRSIDAGADGIELSFGCPHGMCERGMGSAVGQEPKVNEEITSWVKEYSSIPVLVLKLTPNVGDIIPHGLAAQAGGADGVSLINTIKSIIGVDLDQMVPQPVVGNKSSNGGYCGAAVRPIALHMTAALARDDGFNIPSAVLVA